MIATIKLDNFEINNIILSGKIKNNIMNEGYFYRIFYSDQNFTSNGLFICFKLYDIQIEKYFNKIKCYISNKKNNKTIKKIINIEKKILNHFIHQNKIKKYKIKEQLASNFIKIFSDKNIKNEFKPIIHLVLKISGIWKNDYESGITFRFYNTSNLSTFTHHQPIQNHP